MQGLSLNLDAVIQFIAFLFVRNYFLYRLFEKDVVY